MQTQKIEIEIPAHILGALHMTHSQLGQQMKMLTAVWLYLIPYTLPMICHMKWPLNWQENPSGNLKI